MARSISLPALEAYLAQHHNRPVHVLDVQNLTDQTITAVVDPAVVDPVVVDHRGSTQALKVFGYGRPILIRYRVGEAERRVVLHTAPANQFGHENRADRAAGLLLAYDTYNSLAHHVSALDVGVFVHEDRPHPEERSDEPDALRLLSVGKGSEFFLLSQFVEGVPYAQDLQRLRDGGDLTARDLARTERLARYLAEIHTVKYSQATANTQDTNGAGDSEAANGTGGAAGHASGEYQRNRAALYRRRIRDTVGSGEGIMGLIDSYPANFALAGPDWLKDVEQACVAWRWRLKGKTHRLCQVHGDFHPFNIMFGEDTDFYLLDRSRGAWGEAADDVSCLAINYLFFSLQRSRTLAQPFQALWDHFWGIYLDMTDDAELLAVSVPFFVWRALVLANPVWYNSPDAVRRALLRLIESILQEDAFDPAQVVRYINAPRSRGR